MKLIPMVKEIQTGEAFLADKRICLVTKSLDSRVLKTLEKLPQDPKGTPLEIAVGSEGGESYSLTVGRDRIAIQAPGAAGAFYGIQTLRQLLKEERVPCLEIRDRPDFPYRGFYHDATRGRIHTVEAIKKLIDDMAYYKMNSLQLYVEHVFEFEETKGIIPATGYLTKAELRELDAYCQENFIDFVPSLSTFGHMNDILNQPQYRHLRVLKDYEPSPNRWSDRMAHHTIDPRNAESIGLVCSLIDQYMPCFESQWFNICCDETFDLKHATDDPSETGKLYVDFVKQIVAHTQSRGKKVMMWADILLQHPETISELPKDVMFLNWYYHKDTEKMERMISTLADLGCSQIVCPGTTTWNRFCEKYDTEVPNILGMIRTGHKYGAQGVLNTNWGDWANVCSLELGMFGMVLGAAASWNVATENDEAFQNAVNALLYGSGKGVETLKTVSDLQEKCRWHPFVRQCFGEEPEAVEPVQQEYEALVKALSAETWGEDSYRQAFLLAAEAINVMACQQMGLPVDTEGFLARYRESWLAQSKESELSKIEAAFRWRASGIAPNWNN